MYTYTLIYMSICIYIFIHTHLHIHTYTYTNAYINTYIYIYIYMYIYIYIYTNIYSYEKQSLKDTFSCPDFGHNAVQYKILDSSLYLWLQWPRSKALETFVADCGHQIRCKRARRMRIENAVQIVQTSGIYIYIYKYIYIASPAWQQTHRRKLSCQIEGRLFDMAKKIL